MLCCHDVSRLHYMRSHISIAHAMSWRNIMHVFILMSVFFSLKLWNINEYYYCAVIPNVNPNSILTLSQITRSRIHGRMPILRTVNPLRAKLFRGNKIYIYILCHSSILTWHGVWNTLSRKTQTYLFYIVNILASDALVRASKAIILTMLDRIRYNRSLLPLKYFDKNAYRHTLAKGRHCRCK